MVCVLDTIIARLYLLAGMASQALLTYSNLVSLFSLRLGLGQTGLVLQV